MTRTAWLAGLDKDLTAVTSDLGLPRSETQAFDGDGWVWAYRDYLDQAMDGESSRVAEFQVRARPDGLHDGPQLEIIATDPWRVALVSRAPRGQDGEDEHGP